MLLYDNRPAPVKDFYSVNANVGGPIVKDRLWFFTSFQMNYNRAMNTYMTNFNTLMGGTNAGLTSTAQLGSFGQSAANTTANIDLSSADAIAKQQNNAAAARASGYLGEAAGYGRMAGGIIDGAMALPGMISGGIGNLDDTGGSTFGEQVSNFVSGMNS